MLSALIFKIFYSMSSITFDVLIEILRAHLASDLNRVVYSRYLIIAVGFHLNQL